MEGLIVALSCGVYTVNASGVLYNVTARGVFRNQGIKPVVGDKVIINPDNLVIETVFPRGSFLKRPPIANISQIILVFSLKEATEYTKPVIVKVAAVHNIAAIASHSCFLLKRTRILLLISV